MDHVVIRHAALSDTTALIEFWALAGENGARPADRPGLVEQLIERDPESVLIAEIEGRIAATIIAGWDGWRANLYRLAVDPRHRGLGLGRRMVELAEDRLRHLGAERFCAMVLDDNDLGQSLWKSADYSRQAEWRRWVKSAG